MGEAGGPQARQAITQGHRQGPRGGGPPQRLVRQIDSKTQEGLERERRKTIAAVDALNAGDLISVREAARLRSYYKNAELSAQDLRNDREWLWRQQVGEVLTWFRAKLREAGIEP